MIRIANINDIEDINKIGNEFKNNFERTYNLKNYLSSDNYIILVNDEEFINAFMIVYKNVDQYELEMIVVDKNFYKRGIATRMIQYFLNDYLKKNESVILEVAVNNLKALNLYKKFNFEVINIRKKYYNNITDAYVMKKVI